MLVNSQIIHLDSHSLIKSQNKPNNFQNINRNNLNNININNINSNDNKIKSQTLSNENYKSNKTKIENKLNDTLSQISEILNRNNNNLNYSGLINKIPITNEEENFVYEEIILNKKNIKKAKILSNKIKKIKTTISDISSKESFLKSEQNSNKKKVNDFADVLCCFFKN